jgi:hypothetical protein
MRNEAQRILSVIEHDTIHVRGVVDIAQQTCPNSRSPKEGEE